MNFSEFNFLYLQEKNLKIEREKQNEQQNNIFNVYCRTFNFTKMTKISEIKFCKNLLLHENYYIYFKGMTSI